MQKAPARIGTGIRITLSQTCYKRLPRELTFGQHTVYQLGQPALYHCLRLGLLQREPVLVLRVCRPQRIDGHSTESISPFVIGSR